MTKHEVSRGGAETESTGRQHSIIGDILREGRTLGEEDVKKLKECNIRWRDEGLFAVAVWKKRCWRNSSFRRIRRFTMWWDSNTTGLRT